LQDLSGVCRPAPTSVIAKFRVPAYGNNVLDTSKKQPMRIVINDDNVELVKSAFQMLLSKQKIAAVRDYLNTVTTRKWTIDQAKRLLRNWVYI
jgi:hypothetical protein